jgi:hypothetical protein
MAGNGLMTRVASAVSAPVPAVDEPEAAPAPPAAHPTHGSQSGCPYHQALGKGDVQGLREVARQTIAGRIFGDESYAKAQIVLEGALQMDPVDEKGETNALLGKAFFLQERWGDARKHLEVALERDPNNADLKHLLERTLINIQTNPQRPMDTMDGFDAKALSGPPALQLREPQGLKPLEPPKSGAGTRAAEVVRDVSGKVLGVPVTAVEAVVGATGTSGAVWTNWDEAPGLFGAMKLAKMRNDLNKDKLHSTRQGELVGGQQPGQRRPEWTERYRTANGSWNTDDPMEGAAGTEFQAQGAPAESQMNRAEDPSLPSARETSRVMLTSDGPRKLAPFLNSLTMAWIQFETHDWVSHRPSMTDGAYEIPLTDSDPLKKMYGVDHLAVPKSRPNPLPQEGKLTYLNEVTHWWDGSQIYGSDQQTQDRLRMGPDGHFLADGKLRIDGDQLPLNPRTGIEDTGFARNWWVGTDMFHTLFVKEHNHIADVLKQAHPDWSSDQLFQTSRLVNAAILAKIHTTEWTPAILPNPNLAKGMSANWWGLAETLLHPFFKRKVQRLFEPKHPVLGGLVRGKRENFGEPYGFSEKFDEVYRFHVGLPENIDVRKVGEKNASAEIPLDATRGSGARDVMKAQGMATLLNSFGNQHMAAVVNNNYPAFLQELSVDGQAVTDLGTIDILRARERGVPPYNEFRRELGLKPARSFSDLTQDPKIIANLEGLYGKGKAGVEKMDLLVGTLTETDRPEYFGFGETLFQVFLQMASRRLQADPFFTTKFTEQYYSKEGMELVEKATLKDILLFQYPELAQSGLANVNNPFEPWGTTAKSAPEEHPLAKNEKYPKELR